MELILDEHEILNLGKGLKGIKILCSEGHCWVTQSGDSRDHIIKDGECFIADSSGQLLIVATQTCRLMLHKTRDRGNNIFFRILDHFRINSIPTIV